MNRKLTFALAATAIALTPACAQSNVDTADKEAIEEVVRAYILENPEIIEEALIELDKKRTLAEAQRASEQLAERQDDLFANPADYSIGPDDAPVSVVEFFDYRCGFCKRSAEWASELPEKYDGKVRVVFKEMPILSAESEQAALAAIAAGKQGKYIDMHMALMELQGGFKPDDIDGAAESVGVDVAKMRADMKSMVVQKTVADSKSLARELGINGTPNFIIGDQMVNGADTAAVERIIEEALKEVG